MNWILTELGDISDSINTGFASGKHNQNRIGVPHLRPMNISDKGEIILEELKFVESGEHPTLSKGDILFNNTNSPKLLGKTGFIKESVDWFFSNHMTRIRLLNDLNSKFYAYYLHYLYYIGYYQSHCKNHVNQASINKTTLSKIEVPLPPLPEQHRIVEKIEEEFTRLDAGVAELKKAKALIPKYRQSVLKSAMCGDLTKEWRAENPDAESAEVLLTNILAERENLWFSRQNSIQRINGKNNRKKRKYKQPFPSKNNIYSNLPKRWTKASVSQLSFLDVGFAFKSKEFTNEGIPLLRGENLEPGLLRWDEIKYWSISKLKGYEHLLVEDGEIILAMDRPIISKGLKIARVSKADIPALLVQRMTRFKVIRKETESFLYFCLSDYNFIKYLKGGLTGSDLPHITGTNVAEYTIPLPPLSEQHEIVSEIERRFSVIDEVERAVDESLVRAESLRQSILKKAFEGKLVPQDPDDEPASVLLERILAEKKGNKEEAEEKKKAEAAKRVKQGKKSKGNEKEKKAERGRSGNPGTTGNQSKISKQTDKVRLDKVDMPSKEPETA